ncbi:GbsR/MarR family transcriptional regulator [Gelidibacter pelagius]|uniref:MarR family transcriptional regulator n=1 Tax=Gelidibacter pelagius TaxID=2819985 RepID=A0ABS3SSF5_9FLAO|nr:MarR family transcriptional regulator [Gelidibacter pelagius]MBO3098599.1 MarR family transcriptional regulator [Gelidibacter pelagius]
MALSKEKLKLIEEIGLRLETRLQIAPLAARIYALLTLSSYDGLTFEEIREIIGSSKSSTSVNLNVLTQLKHIEYYTKSGDRKRYFRVTKYFQLTTLEAYLESLDNEMTLVEKINAYNKVHFPEKFTNEKSLGDITTDYLRKMQALVAITIEKIKTHQISEE